MGSSSLKAVLYRARPLEVAEVRAAAERIGMSDSQLRVSDPCGAELHAHSGNLPNHASALEALFNWLRSQHLDEGLLAIGQRIVHGGQHYSTPTLITEEVLDDLRSLVSLDPEHLPQAPDVIDRARRVYPSIPQVACFDTAFHRHMPRVAQMFPLPRDLWATGVVRYGFHGLSIEYILQELRNLDSEAADARLIIAHLGNGASMAAVHHGTGVETTMGFTPTGGLAMSSRSGDLDPGVLLHLLESRGLDAAGLSDIVNKRAGLLGVSETSADMRDLLEREAGPARRGCGGVVLLPGAQVPRCPGSRAGRVGDPGLHGWDWRTLRGHSEPHLRRAWVSGPRIRRGRQCRPCADHFRKNEPCAGSRDAHQRRPHHRSYRPFN
jgi:acetate kinase